MELKPKESSIKNVRNEASERNSTRSNYFFIRQIEDDGNRQIERSVNGFGMRARGMSFSRSGRMVIVEREGRNASSIEKSNSSSIQVDFRQ